MKLSRRANVFIAKKYLIDSIYRSAKLEGITITFPQAETIYYGGIVEGLKVDDIVAINNLKHAWSFILDNLDYPLDYLYICEINSIIGSNLFLNPGYFRKGGVFIGEVNPKIWKPNLVIEDEYKDKISELRLIKDPVERAIGIMLYLMRYQPFGDGNKRTAMLAANQILISEGYGILSICESQQELFKEKIADYYISNNKDELKQFILENAIYCPEIEESRSLKELPQMDLQKAKESLLEKVTTNKKEKGHER